MALLMPIYEYRCPNGHTFELFQRMSDPQPEGARSAAGPVERVLYPVAVHYKGSGFYSTDYGRGRPRSRRRRTGDSARPTERLDVASSETKSRAPEKKAAAAD